VEGFGDTFHALFREVYSAVLEGRPPERPTYATFEDGHHEMVVGDAIAASARQGHWVDVADR
jgi:predicted dehydrogenase